jgi:hypothetical protein
MSAEDNHDFLFYFHLLPWQDDVALDTKVATNAAHDFPTVSIPVEIFFYLSDTLQSIPTRRGQFARFPMEQVVIGNEGASRARAIFHAWETIFAEGNNDVVLSFPDRKESFCRTELLRVMRRLGEFAQRVESGDCVIFCSDTPDYRRAARTNKIESPAHAVA